MPIEELDQNQFTRERIKNRMLKRAAEMWGYPESQIGEFDPLVRLLIEACAVEFERTAGEIGRTQNRMLERLAGLLYPGQIGIQPATAIMQARPAEPVETVFQDEQFFCPAGNEKTGANASEIFFTPLQPMRLIDTAIVFRATCRELIRIEGDQKSVIGEGTRKPVEYHHSLWLALETGEEVRSFEGLNFFIQWPFSAEKENWLPWMPSIEWRLEGARLETRSGFAGPDASAADKELEEAFDPMIQFEKEMRETLSRHFVHLSGTGLTEISRIRRRRYPEVFETFFGKKELQELKEPLVWLEIRFPSVIPAEAIDAVSIAVNAFPVINRKLNRIHYKLGQRLNILPLETAGDFLAIREITNSDGAGVKLIPFANAEELPPETYTLRYGVNRFDERNAYEVLTNLTDLIREESSYFSSLGEDFLSQHIRELNQVLSRIESKLHNREKKTSPYPYLMVRPGTEGANILVEFWSCDGMSANRLPAGTRLVSYQNSSLQTDSLLLVSGSAGGRDKFSDAEKIEQYKKTMVTRNRIVTLEDLRRFVKAAVGSHARDIRYRNVFLIGSAAGEGFVKCMEIAIDPEPGRMQPEEWQHFISVLQTRLERASASHIPYRIILTGSGKS